VLVSHRDDLAVLGGDHVQLSEALDERSALGPGGPGAVLCQRKDRDRLPGGCEHVYPLVAILKRQVDQRVPGNATPAGQVKPDRPVWIAPAWRALGAVGYPVGAAAPVAPVVGLAVARVIRGQLLTARPAAFLVRFGFLPPAEAREVQGAEFLEEPGLHLGRPLVEAFGEVGGVHGSLPGSVQAACSPCP